MLDINLEQNVQLIAESDKIMLIKSNVQNLINELLKCKKGLFDQSKNIDYSIEKMKSILTTE